MKKSEYQEIYDKFNSLIEDKERLREHGIESIFMRLSELCELLPADGLYLADSIAVSVVQLDRAKPFNTKFVRKLLGEAGVRKSDLIDLPLHSFSRWFRVYVPFDDPGVEVKRACGCVVPIKPHRTKEATDRRIARLEKLKCPRCSIYDSNGYDKMSVAAVRSGKLPNLKGAPKQFKWAFDIRAKHYRAMRECKYALLLRALQALNPGVQSGQMPPKYAILMAKKYNKELEELVARITKKRFMEESASWWIDNKDSPPVNWEEEFSKLQATPNT